MKKIVRKITLALLFVTGGILGACNEDVSVDAIYITAAEKSPIANFSAKQSGDAMGITISSSLIAKADVEGHLSIDNSLVESYNRAYGENYQSLADGACFLSESRVKVLNGSYRSEVVKLVIKDVEALKKGVNYLLPIKLVSNNKDYPSLPGSDILFVVVNRTLLMNVPKFNGRNYYQVKFKDNDVNRFQNMDAFTIEARVSMWEFPKYNYGNLMGIIGFPEGESVVKSAWLFVDGTPDRVGGDGNIPVFMFGVKQWSVYAGKLGYTLEKNAWYHVAGVFANNKLSLYIDGIFFAEAEYNKKLSFTTNFYIGGTPGVQNGFFLKGAVCEARFWSRALTSVELKNPLHQCFVEVDSNGLEGYWKLDDKSDTCQDYTGHGHTAIKGGTGEIEWQTEVPCPR